MSATHTSGPWTVDVLPKGQARRVFTERIEIWQGNSARLVACMHHKNWSIDGSSDLANARLIAAAPDLLAIAETLVALSDLVSAEDIVARTSSLVADASAAIAKVTGSAP